MKLAVILPHWKREEHRDIIVPYLDKFLSKRGYDYKIFVINQLAATPSEFNRGATKNIGFDIAKKEGYDYFAFHDIDMLPEDDSCDYSYPEKNPTHIAVKCSQFDYGLRYMEYFGGCVLFTKEQFEKVNGYSNGYWNWGMEDDDLFWRVKKNGLANETYMEEFESVTKNVLVLNGVDDYVKIKSYFFIICIYF
jgi:beta-1,4-galactosyltransferase 1